MNLKKLRKSFSYAFRGLGFVFRHEQNFRIQIFCGIIALLAAFVLHISSTRFMILLFTCTLVLILECINTAIEGVSDIVKPRLSEQVEMIKDIMAGAVLLASFFAVIIGICIFWPYLTHFQVEGLPNL